MIDQGYRMFAHLIKNKFIYFQDALDEEALISIGLQNGEVLIVSNDRIVSRTVENIFNF